MTPCDLPPAGWACSREHGHDGPCAARPTGVDLDALTLEQLRSSARGWHEIAFMVEAGATDEEIATVARATVLRDQYS